MFNSDQLKEKINQYQKPSPLDYLKDFKSDLIKGYNKGISLSKLSKMISENGGKRHSVAILRDFLGVKKRVDKKEKTDNNNDA